MQRTFSDEELLAIAKKNSGGGGGGGTDNYNDLKNRPSVNNTILSGNKSSHDLGLASEEDLAGKQDVLTKGQYVDITNKVISVQRDIARDVDAIIETSFDFPNCTVTKTIDEEVVDTVTFSIFGDVPSSVMDVYSVSYNPQAMVLTFTNTVASKEHAVGYTFQVASYSSGVIDTQTFVETVDADKKLIIQSELDTALAGKVDKENGKGLSANDYTNADKAIVDGVTAALSGKQDALTAGLYIEFDGDTISVKRDITQTAQQIAYNFTIPSDFTLRVKKYLNGDLVDTTDYQWNSVTEPINLDEIMEISKKAGNYWSVKNLIASTTQAADYSVDLYAMQQATDYTQYFVATIDADKKLIIQSELDAALADKVDKVAGKGLSKNDYTDADKAKVDASKNEFVGTLDEWDAKTTAQKKEYDTYQITDDYSEALLPNYSTTEQKTGQKWIDGKDIYFKTVEIDNPVSTGTPTSVSHGADVDTIVKFDGYSVNSGVFMPITYYAASNYYAMVYASASSIIYDVNWNNAQFEKIVVTIYYTKTA